MAGGEAQVRFDVPRTGGKRDAEGPGGGDRVRHGPRGESDRVWIPPVRRHGGRAVGRVLRGLVRGTGSVVVEEQWVIRRLEQEVSTLQDASLVAADRAKVTEAAIASAFTSAAERIDGAMNAIRAVLAAQED